MTDEQAIQWLIKKKNFSRRGAEKCLRTFKETMIFAGFAKQTENRLEVVDNKRSGKFGLT